jgi:hypothetical protein
MPPRIGVSFRLPVTFTDLTISLHVNTGAVDAHQHRAGIIWAQHLRAAGAIALNYILFRMAAVELPYNSTMKTAISVAAPMPRKYFGKYVPSHERVPNHQHIATFRGILQHPNLRHLNRHSVAGGVAMGMFSGLVPGPLQILAAALLAMPLRVNLPAALAAALYTNPRPTYVRAFVIRAWRKRRQARSRHGR